ncbi:MAG TPA: hypothetical protein VJI98_05025 [Candidatus Nanoarchaeia archaeon]|nr:hypothetical protein [Candidatus Nanoarchaeia archaeon]
MSLEKEISLIKERNKKVELDKAWETSLTRRLTIAVLTYLVIVIFFYSASLPKPFINSIVPTVGFVLSTLSLPWFKKLWMKFEK